MSCLIYLLFIYTLNFNFVANSQELSFDKAVQIAEGKHLIMPPVDEYGRTQTTNKSGFMFPVSPLSECFIENSANLNLLEIGCAYGNVATLALKNGCASYTACDASEDHLALFAKSIKKSGNSTFSSRLRLIVGYAPNVPVEHTFHRVLIEKVLHTFYPDTIVPFVKWLKLKVKIGGEIFVNNITPDCRAFPECRGIYEQNKKKGLPFPGYISDMATELLSSKPQYPEGSQPESVLFLTLEELSNLFSQNGFKIIKKFKFSPPDKGQCKWQEANDMAAIQAKRIS